ncbi:hypothetical protein DL762_004702 [Monosporascus cannonballus]|uniref:Uncharacterized protein n=1 Tax=Monosporascus cannonballus TaxID=155416 RepID=A0ABY0HBH2_9PEZI|nr:hypothetical protein DL762_004702 [Monosporascus cannonballus]
MAGDRPETRPEIVEDPPANSGQAQRQQHQHQRHGRGGSGGRSGHGSRSRRGRGGQAQNRGPSRTNVSYAHCSPPPALALAPEPEPPAQSCGFDESLSNTGQQRRRPSPSPSPSRSSPPDRIGGRDYHHQREYSYLEEGELPQYFPPHRQHRGFPVSSPSLPRRPDPHPYPEELNYNPFVADPAPSLTPADQYYEDYHGPEQQRGIPHHRGGGGDGRGNQRNPRGGRQALPPQELLWQQQQYRSSGPISWLAAPGGGGEGFGGYGYQYGSGGENHQPAIIASQRLDDSSKGDRDIMDRDSRSRRYDDGEVTRYGAGESYRPFNSNRSPRRARSPPPRERARSPPLVDSDRYVPGRRRSRTPPDRYRRDLSRERRNPRDAGDSWRRGDATRRSPPRRSPPRRSPPRRSPPPPRRFSPPRRDDRDRDRDRDRLRSPRRGFDSRFNPPTQAVNPNRIPLTLPYRRRSRSFDRDRNGRDRTPPPRPSSPPGPRGSTYRGRSRSAERRDDRYVASYHRRPSPPRDSAISSAVPSRDTSRRPSPPGGPPARRGDRSRPESPIPSRPLSRSPHGVPGRDRSPQRTPVEPSSAAARSPPRGPAAFRPPPTGPRDPRGYGGQSATAIGPPPRPAPAPAAPSSRHETSRSNAPAPSPTLNRQEMNTSPGLPPSGPRSHFSSRGGGYSRGGRGGSAWGPPVQSRNLSPTAGPASASPGTTGSAMPPTGPRGSISSHSVPSTPAALSQSKPFDPPKGPAADKNKPSFAQQLLASMPPLVPGGKADPAQLAMDAAVLPELLAHTQRLKEEEERIREEKYAKEERLRKSLAEWDRMERESRVMELRDQLAEETLKKISGEGTGGAAF